MAKREFIMIITNYKDQDLSPWGKDFWWVNFTLTVCNRQTHECVDIKDVTVYVPINEDIDKYIIEEAHQLIQEKWGLAKGEYTLLWDGQNFYIHPQPWQEV